jgi:hypothetical protein
VESGIKYVRGNFLCGRQAHSVEDLRGQMRGWVWNVANVRVHGTTHRVICDAWLSEKAHRMPLMGRVPYPLMHEVTRRVSRDAYIAYRGNRYSVPWTAAGQEVCVREEADRVWIVRFVCGRGGERLAGWRRRRNAGRWPKRLWPQVCHRRSGTRRLPNPSLQGTRQQPVLLRTRSGSRAPELGPLGRNRLAEGST